MKTKQSKEIVRLKAQIETLTAERDRACAIWAEEARKAGMAMSNSLKLGQAEKRLLIIDHIIAGRTSEAIAELLKPLPVAFSMKVVYADDKTANAAKEQALETIKKRIVEMVEDIHLVESEAQK